MTTISQVKKAVQPLLQRNHDLALVGRLVVLKPVHHILRGVYIDRSSIPDEFMPPGLSFFCSSLKPAFRSIGVAASTILLLASGM